MIGTRDRGRNDDCSAHRQAVGRAYTTFAIALRLRPCCTGTALASRLSRVCSSCRLTLGTFACVIPTGISRRPRANGTSCPAFRPPLGGSAPLEGDGNARDLVPSL